MTLSLIHAAIPNHWLPLVAIGKSEDWDIKETLTFTGVAGLAHTLSTIIIGILVGLAGYTLSEHYTIITQWIAPIILIGLG
ncbi:MAG: hypothetical protein GWN62_31380, partial [Aliifodinibius sp.]|nr:hypothetical protein [Fodinibius sp.]NIW78713.1 hypothetical protein [Calditrichia bacterium]